MRLEFNAAKVYVEGKVGVIETRVVNTGAREIEKVTVDVRSDLVSNYGRRVTKPLPPGKVSRKLQTQLDLSGGRAGEHLVGFEAKVELLAEEPAAYCGEAAILVLPPDASAQSFVVNVHGASVSADGKGMMGAYVNAPVHLQEAIEAGRIKTAADYLIEARNVEPDWRAVELGLDEERTGELRRAKPGAKAVTRRAQHSTKLRLDIECPVEGPAEGPFGSRRLVVLSKREVTFGKSRRGADICTLVLPLSRENARLSKQISGRFDGDTGESSSHMALRLASSGLEVLDHSRNGTFVDGKMVAKGAPAPLGREARLSLGDVLDLGVRAVAPGQEFDPAHYMPLVRGGLFEEAQSSRVAAASIERLNNFPGESYLVLYSGAALGSSRDVAVPLAGAGLAPRHLLLLHLGDGFYVENISGRADGANLNGSALEPDRLEPLSPGDTIRAGGVEIRVDEFEQLRPEA